MKSFSSLQEDLRKWFSKTDPAGDWKRINSKGEAIGPCAREPGEPKPKCMSRAKRESLTKKERASAVRAKRKHDPNPERKGEPINVSNFGKGKISENMENLEEKNVPTSPEKWAQAKAQAKAKFDVYPSAYANGWAAKKYKEMGGSWKSVSEAVKDKYDKGEYDQEGDMAKSDLRSIIANAQKLHDMIDDADNLPEWVQSKITLAEDYISTVANYMMSEIDENFEMNLAEGDEDIHSHRVGDEVVLKNKNYQGVIVKSKGSDISFKNKSDNKHYKATHSMIARNLSKENRHKEKSAEQNKKFDDAIASDMKRIDKSGALKKFGIGVKEQVEQIDSEVVQEATYVVKHDGVSSDHADADAKKLFAGKTNVNSHMTKYVSSAEKHANMLKSKGFKNVRIQTMNKEEVEAITELSSETLDRYKEKAKKSSDSLASQGKYRQANDRTMNVMKATGKQIDKTVANIRKSLNNDATPAQRSLQPNNKTMVRESRRLEIVREAMTDAKKKDQKKKIEKKVEMNGSDKFESEPELSSQIIKNNV